jgi:hypothetical protein
MHGVLAGIDTPVLLSLYVVTGGGVLVLAASRYLATSHREEAEQLGGAPTTELAATHARPASRLARSGRGAR